MSRRLWLVLLVLALGAASVAGLILAGRSGAFSIPGAEPLTLADADATAIDTVAFRGRRVVASLNGVVDGVADDGTVWLLIEGGTVPLVFPEPPRLRPEDRVLAVGRLRGEAGQRRVDVESWVRVVTAAR